MYCGERCSVKNQPGAFRLATLFCRSWSCPECQPRRRLQLIAEACRGRPDTLITLTLPDAWASRPAAAVKTLSRAWRLIRKREGRLRDAPPVPFFAVIERTRRGTPHLHILARSKWIDQQWLSRCMDELAAAPIVDIRRIDHRGRVAGYVAKYVGKDLAKLGTNKRYWQSRDFAVDARPERPPLEPGEWWGPIWNAEIGNAVRDLIKLGYSAEWDGPTRCLVRRATRHADAA